MSKHSPNVSGRSAKVAVEPSPALQLRTEGLIEQIRTHNRRLSNILERIENLNKYFIGPIDHEPPVDKNETLCAEGTLHVMEKLLTEQEEFLNKIVSRLSSLTPSV